MHLPHKISHPFHHGQSDEAAGSIGTTDATSPAPSRPPERRKSKFFEEGIVGEEKLELRSGEETDTFDSVVSPPARVSEHVAEEKGLGFTSRKSEWRREEPFGDEGAEAKYKTMTWWQAALVMAAEIISLGIFVLPSALNTLGIVPGVILIIGFGILSTYTGYVLWKFRIAHPFVHNLADVGELLGGRLVREAMGTAQIIFLIFIMGRHIIFFNISFNKITSHAKCTIAWATIALIISFIATIPRTLKTLSYLSITGLLSVFAAAFITMIGVGSSPPQDTHLHATNHATFASAFLAVSPIIFSYSAHISFFTIISELRHPRDFPKALITSQTAATVIYLVLAVVIYRYTGDKVSSLAIENASPVVQKVAYGIALPTIVVSGVIYAHIAAKYIYVRLFRGTTHLAKQTTWSVGSWLLIVLALWIVAFVIAESIPGYGYLFGLICAIFTSWFTYGLAGILWLFTYVGIWRQQRVSAILNIGVIMIALGMMGIGVYSSGKAMHDDSDQKSWSCADTSSSSW